MGPEAGTSLMLTFADPQATGSSRLRGAKGRSLALMRQKGMPVPPGFTITTATVRNFREHDEQLTPGVTEALHRAMTELERETGLRFGDARRPLLVSARSGAAVSMPGMMDTILNIGLTKATYPGLVARGGAAFAADCRSRLRAMFLDIVGAEPPQDPWAQLLAAIRSVYLSWNNPRACDFRDWSGLDHSMGTAVTIQSMVYGNRGPGSGTGVARSCEVNTGDRILCGEYLPNAQGEDVVAGTHTPLQLSALQETLPVAYKRLYEYAYALEDAQGTPVEIEFTIEEGTLYLLQYRKAVLSPTAAAVRAVRLVSQDLISSSVAVTLLTKSQIEHLLRASRFDPETLETAKMEHLLGSGLSASTGVAVGRVAFTSARAIEMVQQDGTPAILVRCTTDPSDLPGMLAASGIVTEVGGFTSHGAVVANSQRKPAVVGTGALNRALVEGEWISIDSTGTVGFVLAGKLSCTPLIHEKEVKKFLTWVRLSHWKKTGCRSIDPKWLSHKLGLNGAFADFYLTWAMEREAMGSELEGAIGNLRRRVHGKLASVMTCYLAAAIIREFNDSQSRGAAYVCARDDLDWIESRCNAFSGTYQLPEVVEHISCLSVAEQAGFFHHAANIFRKGHWEIAFCGEPWAVIAEIVAAYLEGVIPDDTTFVDQAFNLQHHGGRLFDKHPLVKNEFSNETVLRGQLNANLNAASLADLFVTVCLPSPCDTGLGFMFEPAQEVMGVWRRGVEVGLWKVAPQAEAEARVCLLKCEKLHQPHRCDPVKVGPFTVYAAGIHDLGTSELEEFKSDTNSVLVLLSEDQLDWHCNSVDYTVLHQPMEDFGGVPENWKGFIQKLFDLLVGGKRVLIACSKGHGRTGCCIASLIAFIESGERTPDPLAAVRQRHCREAVETRKQAEAIFALRDEPLPTRYWPQFPERKNRVTTPVESWSDTEFAP